MADTQKKRVVLVRKAETKPEQPQDQGVQLPKIAGPTTTGKKRTVIVERKAKAGEALQPLTPRAEQVAGPPKPKGPIYEADGSIVEWSVLGSPEEYRDMAAATTTPAKQPQQQATKKPPPTSHRPQAQSQPPQPQPAAKSKNVTEEMFGNAIPAYEHGQLERQAKALERLSVV
jgi:hypothetical protein